MTSTTRTADVYARFVDVGARLVRPTSAARDRACSFDRDVWRAVAGAGLFSIEAPHERRAAVEGLARGSLDLGFSVTAVAHLVVVEVLERYGSDAQRLEVLPKLRDGTLIGACANAEPGAGTDLMGLKSYARPRDGGYALTARKRSITNVGAADVALVSARVLDVPAAQSVNVFLIDTAGERRFVRARKDLMGLRTSPTGTLLCRRALVHEGARVGAVGGGVELFRFMFSSERIYTGALYLAAIRACLGRALAHAEERVQFGAPIGRNQYVQEKIVQMRIAEELLAAHLDKTHARFIAGEDTFGSLSIVKAYGVDAAIAAAHDLVRLLGARGLSTDDVAERLLRDLLALSILGGTVELQKIVIYNEAAKAR